MTFVASLVRSLAWPVVVVSCVYVFRAQLRPLFARPLRRAKFGSAEVEWEQSITKAGQAIDEVVATEQAQPPIRGSRYVEEFTPVADINPSAAVLSSWAHFEKEVRASLAVHMEVGSTGVRPWLQAGERAHLLDPEVVEAVGEASRLRNLVAHDDLAPTRRQALDFLILLDDMSPVFERLRDASIDRRNEVER
jgi:hypothetical protein